MKIRFIGVGTQSSGPDQYHSNMVITAHTGKRMLIDCGGDVRFALAESGISTKDLDAVYISHLHADHVGGMEWLALSTFFAKECRRLTLFGEKGLLNNLWNNSLKGGLECLRWKRMTLADYFDCQALAVATPFLWEGIRFEMVKMRHIVGEECNHDSYGLLVEHARPAVRRLFISTDALLQPDLLENISRNTELIFHDCETSQHQTNVHAHYDQLCTLSAAIKQKIWLYHYQPDHNYLPQEDGFQGFVVKGQEFSFDD